MVDEQNCTDFNKTSHVKIKNGISTTDVVSALMDAPLTWSDFYFFLPWRKKGRGALLRIKEESRAMSYPNYKVLVRYFLGVRGIRGDFQFHSMEHIPQQPQGLLTGATTTSVAALWGGQVHGPLHSPLIAMKVFRTSWMFIKKAAVGNFGGQYKSVHTF